MLLTTLTMPLLYSGLSDSYDSKDVHGCNGKTETNELIID